MKKIISTYLISLLAFFASPVFAAVPRNFRDLIQVTIIGGILRPLVPLLIGLAVVVFIYGVLVLIFSEGGDKKEDGKKYMFWGIIGIFVMVSVWGLVAILQSTFGFDSGINNIPSIQIQPIIVN